MKIVDKSFYRLRVLAHQHVMSNLRRVWWTVQGAHIGKGTRVPKMNLIWPHQLRIGENCNLENEIYFKFDGIWQPGPGIDIHDNVFVGRGCEFNIRRNITIKANCLIASGCKFIDHDHGMALGEPMNVQSGPESAILIEEDVWLGANVLVLKGVTISQGAVVGAGAVVTKSIPPFEIWGGIPARRLSTRLPETQYDLETPHRLMTQERNRV